MSTRIPLRCRCGTVRGFVSDVSPAAGKHAFCYCDDCQIYALHLGRGDILDAYGGTEALMSTPAQVTLTQGASELRCVRLVSKGLFRWYAGCCNTPLANAVNPGLPVLIVVVASLDLAALSQSADEALGPPKIRMHARFAKGGQAPGAHPKAPLKALPLLIGHLVSAFLRGRGQPSPFFDASGQPRVEPHFIDKAEREALRARVQAAVNTPV
jgi:hypothetical protein